MWWKWRQAAWACSRFQISRAFASAVPCRLDSPHKYLLWDIFDERRREYFEHTEPPASVPQKLVKAIDRAYNISSWRETLQRNGVIRLHTNIAPSDAPMSADEIGDLIRALFAPSAALLKELSASAHGCKVCLHIRTGDQAMRVGKTLRSNEAQQHAMVAEACELAGCRDGRSARICLATDSQDLKRRLISQWKGNIVARNGSVAHTDRSIWRHEQTTSPGARTWSDDQEGSLGGVGGTVDARLVPVARALAQRLL